MLQRPIRQPDLGNALPLPPAPRLIDTLQSIKFADSATSGDRLDLRYRWAAQLVVNDREVLRMASHMLANASSSVAPWDQQPGNPGTETA